MNENPTRLKTRSVISELLSFPAYQLQLPNNSGCKGRGGCVFFSLHSQENWVALVLPPKWAFAHKE